MIKDSIDSRLKKLNDELNHTNHKHISKRKYGLYSLTFVFGILVLFSAFYFGPSITGFITFNEAIIHTEDVNIKFPVSEKILLDPDLSNFDALMISGSLEGKGRTAVFLEQNNTKKLVYFFEGDATNNIIDFSNVCYETCHLRDTPNNALLSVELDGMTLELNKVSFMSNRLIDMELLPEKTVIDYNKEKAKIVELKLINKRSANYSIILMIDGPLINSFSWQGSLIKMNDYELEKVIPIAINLPSNLPEGSYTHKITARYIPNNPSDFTGPAPVTDVIIEIIN